MNSLPYPVARLANAVKRYGQTQALAGVDLEVHRGEVLALLGPNGAGKTTAISLLVGLQQADTGSASLFDSAPNALAARRRIGAMLQATSLPETLTVGELIDLFRNYYARPRTVADVVALAGIDDLLDCRYAKLSGGQQRRAQFALAICGRAELLFLDEPTTGLDIDARETMWSAIRQLVAEGCAVVLTTHYLEEAEALADRVVVLAQGRIVAQGTVAEIRARVASRRIRCVTTLADAAIALWPEVRSVARDGGRVEIVTDAAEMVVRQLLFEDAQLSELEVRRAGLAEAFVEITKEAA
ncbi:ABC transporter ATP-binding protein [Rudaea cellulosilytica]|uniref:ABC transporter ATP-binding protein n=1 Tax=Rudaea cellulosilytica TaxID=540746 RepID=UPI000366BB46|nr:ABC transporter ATP-binding protein [Rudaea cellulosilytica]